jgi:(p)ppGpp synthase/HD superfamily hydrolase
MTTSEPLGRKQVMPQDRDFSRRFGAALRFANELHAAQTRKSTTIPYISHLMGVASLVLEHGGSADEAIAALLHDSVEDQAEEYPGGATSLRAYIHDAFGPAVLEIVNGCTDADSHPKPPWRERKERYVAHLATASASIRLVSCADKLHNARAILSDLRSIGGGVFARFTAGREGTLWYYRQLADTFTALGPSLLAAELDRTVREIEALGR